MLTLFASIVGFVGSLVPEIFKFLKDKSDKAYLQYKMQIFGVPILSFSYMFMNVNQKK